jgi:chlorite dismutase
MNPAVHTESSHPPSGQPQTPAQAAPQGRPASAGATDTRQIVSFTFYRLNPEWRRLPVATRAAHVGELCAAVNGSGKSLVVQLAYSLVGLKADTDFMLWRVGESVERVQESAAALNRTQAAGYLTTAYSYLSMTRRSVYVDKLDPSHMEQRRFITPMRNKYLFIYPFWKTHDWYMLPMTERQAMMDEHIVVGNKYPSVKIHTSYAFGLDDPDFVLAFESDSAKDFLDLVMELRGAKARPYTLRDTPIFTCVLKPLDAIWKELGA